MKNTVQCAISVNKHYSMNAVNTIYSNFLNANEPQYNNH